MKLNFQNLNVEPMPNPKPLSVLRVSVRIAKGEGNTDQHSQVEHGFIRNAAIDPIALTGRG
jgi:hypothetical protein